MREVRMWSAVTDTGAQKVLSHVEYLWEQQLPCGKDVGLCKNSLVVFLTCVDEQTRQGTEQFQGQDGQDEVKIQPAGLREGMLYAQDEEEWCVAWEEGISPWR